MIQYAGSLVELHKVFPSMIFEISSAHIAGKVESHEGNLSFLITSEGNYNIPEKNYGTEEELANLMEVIEVICTNIRAKQR